MTEEALKIRDYIVNSDLPERAKNEILPLLGVIDAPGVKERILKILEVEGKVLDVEEKFLNLDIENPNGTPAPVPPVAPVPEPAPINPVPTPIASQPIQIPTVPPVAPQPTADDQNIAQLQQQLQQLKQQPQ